MAGMVIIAHAVEYATDSSYRPSEIYLYILYYIPKYILYEVLFEVYIKI